MRKRSSLIFLILIFFVACIFPQVTLTNYYAERCSTRYVTVCVQDSSTGFYVPDLAIDDFVFFENHTPLDPPMIELLNSCPSESLLVDIVLFLDLSLSMDEVIYYLRDNLSGFVAGISSMNYRISIVIFNGCLNEITYPTIGIRDQIKTNFSDPLCRYSSTGTDIWATSLDEFQCLFDAGWNEYYTRPTSDRGSGDEDQYGAMAEFASSIIFRPSARRVFVLFTDESPIYSYLCAPSWGDSEEDLDDFTDVMLTHNITCIPVTPRNGEFVYSRSESPDRAYYLGYYTLANETGGEWVYLYNENFLELVGQITDVITPDSCCYEFVFTDSFFCTPTNQLHVRVDPWGNDEMSFQALCPPEASWLVPSPFCGGWSTCPDQGFQILFSSYLDIGIAEAEISINGISYDLESDIFTVIDDSVIIFQPETDWNDGDTVYLEMLYAVDDSGCIIHPESCSVLIDLSPPVFFDEFPPDGSILYEIPERIYFLMHDSLSGIDLDNINEDWFDVSINGISRDFDIILSGDTVFFEGLSFINGDTVSISVTVPDSPDYEYCMPNIGEFTFSFYIYLSAPYARIILPDPGTISACRDQEIWIEIISEFEINYSTVELLIKDQLFRWGDPELSFRSDTLIFKPSEGFWIDGEHVDVQLLRADNIYGLPLSSPLSWSFYIDFSPPYATLISPRQWIYLSNPSPTLTFDLSDNLSGNDITTLGINVDTLIFDSRDLNIHFTDSANHTASLDLDHFGIYYPPGDTISISLSICDSPDTCVANCSTYFYTIMIEPRFSCLDIPDPFTPNGDNINDNIIFSYPGMFSQDAELVIFNKRREEIFRKVLKNSNSVEISDNRLWSGVDNKNRMSMPGIYLYIIIKNGELICEGTITLIR